MHLVLGFLFLLDGAVAADTTAGATTSVAAAPDVVARYEVIRLALAQDRLDDARSGAGDLAQADVGLRSQAEAVAAAVDAPGARLAFGELSRALVLRLAADASAPKVFAYHCPMASGFPWWLQAKPGIANPYMGTAMPECGEEKSLKGAVKSASQPG
jgi:hypothetical protein